ncbi:MAG: IS200/IS605 family transposase [Scytonematopsis contorta HA4267-MV1]|jgi:putative transposase|nr:IS200/IS605 family transposase [Scytonematopsis contorta HA4267-MV1]
MPLWRLYYHLVWTNKERQPMITLNKETELYGYIIGKSDALNCIVHAVGGTENHIHLVVSIPPTLAISEFTKKIKGSSSHHLNHSLNFDYQPFSWQEGYGVFAFGSKQLEQTIAYVNNQKIHHYEGTTNSHLEKTTD